MKKIIKNKVYDTTTAQKCGEWDNGHYTSDFAYCGETLYRKKTGEFFLHGEGNAASKYARSCGQNERCGGEKIVPLTYAEAQAWAEEHLDGDDYISIFGEPEESEELGDLHVRISAAKMQKLKQAASQAQVSLAEMIERLIGDTWGGY